MEMGHAHPGIMHIGHPVPGTVYRGKAWSCNPQISHGLLRRFRGFRQLHGHKKTAGLSVGLSGGKHAVGRLSEIPGRRDGGFCLCMPGAWTLAYFQIAGKEKDGPQGRCLLIPF